MNLVNMHNSIFFKPISFMKSGFLFFTFLIIIFVNPVLALDWNDDDWVQGGCTPDIFGTWVSPRSFAHPETPKRNRGS